MMLLDIKCNSEDAWWADEDHFQTEIPLLKVIFCDWSASQTGECSEQAAVMVPLDVSPTHFAVNLCSFVFSVTAVKKWFAFTLHLFEMPLCPLPEGNGRLLCWWAEKAARTWKPTASWEYYWNLPSVHFSNKNLRYGESKVDGGRKRKCLEKFMMHWNEPWSIMQH